MRGLIFTAHEKRRLEDDRASFGRVNCECCGEVQDVESIEELIQTPHGYWCASCTMFLDNVENALSNLIRVAS